MSSFVSPKAGKLIGVAVEAMGQGYADTIHFLYGYDPINQRIIGFKVLESKETPGIGSRIETDKRFFFFFNPKASKWGPLSV